MTSPGAGMGGGWAILWGGLKGSDSTFHLQLADWVRTTFPGIDWWYRWDGMGLSYREGYPLAPSWIAAALAEARSWTDSQAMQVIQFLINPLCALGVYAYGAFRMRNPLAGIFAAILYLLSPIIYTLLLDWGFFASQLGTIFVMPALIAIDVLHAEWEAGRFGARFRLAAGATIGLAAITGLVSPTALGAPLVAIAVYALACDGWRSMVRWLVTVTPLTGLVTFGLSVFWGLPLIDTLAVSASRAPGVTYSPSLFPHWDLGRMLQLQPPRLDHVEDRVSLVPAAWVPALAGMFGIFWNGRVRVLLALAALGFAITSYPVVSQLLFSSPLYLLLNSRTGIALVQFAVPLLSGYALGAMLPLLALKVANRVRASRPTRIAAIGAALALSIVVGAADVNYQVSAMGPVDVWQRHLDNGCQDPTQPLCQTALAATFNVVELVAGCRTSAGELRGGVEICADLGSASEPRWDPANDGAIARLVDRCMATRDAFDQVCRARWGTYWDQVTDLNSWRGLEVGCLLRECSSGVASPQRSDPPARVVLDARIAPYIMAFHTLTGGGQFYSYNFENLPTPELDDFMKATMLESSGTASTKAQLAEITGADAAIPSTTTPDVVADYVALGWQPFALGGYTGYRNPNPSGLAVQWPQAATVLVVGQVAGVAAHPYNDLLEQAVGGMIPFDTGWLVRSPSPYIDDYSDQELSRYPALLLLSYHYHDAGKAWDLLNRYVRNGGSLYVETGWQYNDPDWNISQGYGALPVADLRWGALDPGGQVQVEGAATTDWGAFTYGQGGWSASSSAGVRPGAEALVSVGGRVVVARWSLGSGRVVWSGMNLMAHSEVSKSAAEARFLANQWSWLLSRSGPAPVAIDPQWTGNDDARLPVQASPGPVSVLFKESSAPGWSAELTWPGGSRAVAIDSSELDFMLVRLDSVPAGATLAFHFGPTPRMYLWWAVSLTTLVLLAIWVATPAPFRWAWRRSSAAGRRLRDRALGSWASE